MNVDKDRFVKFASVFGQKASNVADTAALRKSLQSLEKLKSSEMRIWWDSNTLKTYMDRKMTPRDLRLKKIPTTVYSPEFLDSWNSILSKCSLALMALIAEYEEIKLTDISQMQSTLTKKFSSSSE